MNQFLNGRFRHTAEPGCISVLKGRGFIQTAIVFALKGRSFSCAARDAQNPPTKTKAAPPVRVGPLCLLETSLS
jgi:hypothetical protein